MKTAVRDQVNALDVGSFFKFLAELMKTNPPAPEDAPMLEKLALIGIVPGQDFDISRLDQAVVKGLEGAPKAGIEKIMSAAKAPGKKVNGWAVTTNLGTYGTNYMLRAVVTAIGLGANLPQDAVYPKTRVDIEGNTLNGANKYIISFPKAQTPHVKGFWSLTMYDHRYFFVNNPLHRYTLSPRNDLKYNADGSLDLYIQNESPGPSKESNWLPAPKGNFILMLRLYWPNETPPSILDGSWSLPPVKKLQ